MGYTNYPIARPGFIADVSSVARVSRQVDFDRVPDSFEDTDGNKVVSGAIIVSEIGSGKVVPRSSTKGAITNLTEDGGTATVTEAGHGREVGENITISGSAVAAYNGDHTIASVVDENSYTIEGITGAPADDAAGATVVTPAVGILEASAVENSKNAALSGQSMLIGGAVYVNLLEDAEDENFETYKTELKAAGNWWFEEYADNRSS